jgi:hypothetical protein
LSNIDGKRKNFQVVKQHQSIKEFYEADMTTGSREVAHAVVGWNSASVVISMIGLM